MTQALTSRTPHPEVCLDGYVSVLHRLATEWAITVEHAPLPATQVGAFDPTSRTVQLRADAAIEDQLWLLVDLWFLLTIGRHSTSGARPQPHLYLVPAPRTAN